MNRYWYGLIGLGLLITVIVFEVCYVCHTTVRMEEMLSSAEEQLVAENDEASLDFFNQSAEYWKKNQTVLELVLDHSTVEQVDILLTEARAFLQYRNRGETAAVCRSLLQQLRSVREDRIPGWNSLF